jgi:hypothetical protein
MSSSQVCSAIPNERKLRHGCVISLSLNAHIRYRNTHLTYAWRTCDGKDAKRDVLESRPIRATFFPPFRVDMRSKHHSRLPHLNNHHPRPSKRHRLSMLEL